MQKLRLFFVLGFAREKAVQTKGANKREDQLIRVSTEC